MLEWSTASHCHCGGNRGLRGTCHGCSLCAQIYATQQRRNSGNATETTLNEILPVCWAVGIYLITITPEQISGVIARCYHFTVWSHYAGLPRWYTSF